MRPQFPLTCAAAVTLISVYFCVVIINGNCSLRAFFHADSTAEAAIFTNGLCNLAYVGGGTLHHNPLTLLYKHDKVIWTSLNALPAGNTLRRIYNCNTVFYSNATVIADSSAVAHTVTARLAFALAVIEFFYCSTAF